MNLSNNTILITGGGTGIGRGLAEALHARGNQVIIAGRRREPLTETTAANDGMKAIILDTANPHSIAEGVRDVLAAFPHLNVVINNAGIMRIEKLTEGAFLDDAEQTVTTNLLGPIRMTQALLPHLLQQRQATIINVTSGLAFTPLADTPTYCATKAALHSYSMSLRYQLKDTAVNVLELAPPYVQTDLLNGADDPRAMPLQGFIAEVMQLLETQPAPEILVDKVMMLRNNPGPGEYEFFGKLNAMMSH